MPLRNVSYLLKKIVAASQKWKCKSCKVLLDECYEVDHIKCLKDSGTNDQTNLQALCPHCHRKKTMNDMLLPKSKLKPESKLKHKPESKLKHKPESKSKHKPEHNNPA